MQAPLDKFLTQQVGLGTLKGPFLEYCDEEQELLETLH